MKVLQRDFAVWFNFHSLPLRFLWVVGPWHAFLLAFLLIPSVSKQGETSDLGPILADPKKAGGVLPQKKTLTMLETHSPLEIPQGFFNLEVKMMSFLVSIAWIVPLSRMQSSPPGFLNMFRFRDPNLNLHLPRTGIPGPGYTSNPSYSLWIFLTSTKRLRKAKLQKLALSEFTKPCNCKTRNDENESFSLVLRYLMTRCSINGLYSFCHNHGSRKRAVVDR